MDGILEALRTGLPVLVTQFGLTLALLGIGTAIYMLITPFHEMRMVREGNAAAGVVLAGTLVSIAIPLGATLASSRLTVDILIWGVVALVLQLITFGIASLLIRGLRGMIESGNTAAAWVLVGIQLAVAILNAGAMAG